MSIRFLFSGKQWEYISGSKELFCTDYQKGLQAGDKLVLDKVLSNDNEFGQPFLSNIKLQAEVIGHELKKITILKYKPKKRGKKKMGFRSRCTWIKIIRVDKQ